MPRGSTPQLLGAWKRWFGPYFTPEKLTTDLAEMQRRRWLERYRVHRELPDNLVIYIGRRRRPKVTLAGLEGSLRRQHLAGCERELLAPYKDSFQYVLKVLQVLSEVRDGLRVQVAMYADTLRTRRAQWYGELVHQSVEIP